jgi:hypothetical protein
MLDLIPDFSFFFRGWWVFQGRSWGSTVLALSTLHMKGSVTIEALVTLEAFFSDPCNDPLDDVDVRHYLTSGIKGLPPR